MCSYRGCLSSRQLSILKNMTKWCQFCISGDYLAWTSRLWQNPLRFNYKTRFSQKHKIVKLL